MKSRDDGSRLPTMRDLNVYYILGFALVRTEYNGIIIMVFPHSSSYNEIAEDDSQWYSSMIIRISSLATGHIFDVNMAMIKGFTP